MAYPAATDAPWAPAPTEEGLDLGYRDVEVWSVHTHIHPDLHACTSVSVVGGVNRMVRSEKLGCYEVKVRSRRQALLVLLDTVTQALHDLGEQDL